MSRAALDAGVRHLIRAQDALGRWRDYPDAAPGPSSEWTTALVGLALAEAGERRAPLRAWRWLRARGLASGAWGWNGVFARDADSTTWGLLLAHAIRRGHGLRARRARRALALHDAPAGGVRTFRPEGPLRRFGVDLSGWGSPHVCVTALAAGLPDPPPSALAFLRGRQLPFGAWEAYWWGDHEYATALAAEALHRADGPGDAERVARAVAWLARRVDADGAVRSVGEPSAFATAWALRGLRLAPQGDEAAARAEAWLASSQTADGSWPASAWLRLVPTHVTEPSDVRDWGGDGGERARLIVDGARLHTTAAVVSALARGRP